MALPPGVIYAVIGVMAAVENIVPPLPADTAVALGAFLSSAGRVSATSIFLITWVANVAGATAVYVAGRTVGRSFFAGRLGQRLLKPGHLERLEGLYRRHGTWGIFVSRFLPGLRAIVPPFAGVARLGVWRALVPAALASGLWYAALTYVAATFVKQVDDLVTLVDRLNRGALLLGLLVLFAGLVVLWRHRRGAAS